MTFMSTKLQLTWPYNSSLNLKNVLSKGVPIPRYSDFMLAAWHVWHSLWVAFLSSNPPPLCLKVVCSVPVSRLCAVRYATNKALLMLCHHRVFFRTLNMH